MLTFFTELYYYKHKTKCSIEVKFWNKVCMALLYSRDTTIRIHIHAETLSKIITNEDTSLEKYTSHILFESVANGLCVCEMWVGDGTDCNILTPVPLTIAAFLSHSAGLLDRGSLGAASPLSGAGSHYLELQLELQLTDANKRTAHPVAPSWTVIA